MFWHHFPPFSWATTSIHTVFVWCLVNYCLFFNKLHQIYPSQANATAMDKDSIIWCYLWYGVLSICTDSCWAWIFPTVLKWPLFDLSAGPSHPIIPSHIPTYIEWDLAVWSMCGGPRWLSDMSYILALYIHASKIGNSSALNSKV